MDRTFFPSVTVVLSAALAQTPAPSEALVNRAHAVVHSRCLTCHSDQVQMGGLKLTTRETLLKGGTRGPAVIPGDPEGSRLIQAIAYGGDLKMPPTGKLPDDEIASLREWVRQGAPWPDRPRAGTRESKHWAFELIRDAAPPAVKDAGWVRNPIDRFILARLEASGLSPAPPVDRIALLRRAKFDLHGLPPSEEEIREFLADKSPDAFARLVDRLLDSPRYGEKWGRHWLDVARFADTTGGDADKLLEDAWRYRDYVIDAFNADTPYDWFVREQIAGDLAPATDSTEVNVRGIIATGFLALGPKQTGQTDKVRQFYDVVDEQIDTTSKVFLGVTIACARCHDHKFDPITTRDYYSLASIFASTKVYANIKPIVSSIYSRPLVPDAVHQQYQKHQDLARAKQSEIDAVVEPEISRYIAATFRPRLPGYMIAAREVYAKGADPTAVAQRAGLPERILKRWVEYLKPGTEFRPWLGKWHKAAEADLPRVAAEYLEMHEQHAAPLHQKMLQWQQDVPAALRDGKPVPKKPAFAVPDVKNDAEKFFAEVSIKDGPFVINNDDRDAILPDAVKQRAAILNQELERLKKESPPAPPMANAVIDGEIIDQPVFIRGSHHNKGEIVPKQFPVILAGASQPPIRSGSGRKELAEWLTWPDHPLTARVMANRLWLWHFGEGLVRTPDNFGATGEKPTHPELLDYLAKEFMRRSWSMKSMHRLIMQSSAYRMSATPAKDAASADPENRLWSHFMSRRLSFEEIRDSFLALDGAIDLTMGGSTAKDVPRGENYTKKPGSEVETSRRRSVYLPLLRNKLPPTMNLFDFVDATTCTGKRTASNIAPQALFMLNSEFMHERARGFAASLLKDSAEDAAARIDRAYRTALARPPTPEEGRSDAEYIRQYPKSDETSSADHQLTAWTSFCRVLMASNEFNYVD